jgi:hypothetical protein
MKQKILVIKLISGRIIERDLTNEKVTRAFGAPANDIDYAKICQGVCVNGYTDPDCVSETNYTHIAPSQIETVSMSFREKEDGSKS